MVHWLGIEHTKILDVGDAQDLVVITFDTHGPPTVSYTHLTLPTIVGV